MSTFNDNIRRELGFGLIAWNAPEHRLEVNLSGPRSGKSAQESGCTGTATPTAKPAGRAILSRVR